MANPLFLAVWLLSHLISISLAQQSVMASNRTDDLPQTGSARYLLNTTDVGIPRIRLFPLSHLLAFPSQGDFDNIRIVGSIIHVGDDPTVIKPGDVAYISCDPSAYPGQLTADDIVSDAVQNPDPPAAVILYSALANHCNYSIPDNVRYDSVFTTVDPMLASNLQARLENTSAPHAASILPDLSSMQQADPTGNSNNGSSDSNTNNVLGPSPTTAVAMIILYSITGIITALFLVIIVTGAIRAHRHPERYGPRNTLGRPRQSRAKGLARAMLETLPIVKFGDPEPGKGITGSDNLELGHTDDETRRRQSTDTTTPERQESTQDAPEHTVSGGQPNDSTEDTSLNCSICTEDFTKGQDIRVLPCNHKFHPDCVDPWLLNVSGTCPLCRVDLRPTTSNNSDTPALPNDEFAPPLEEVTETSNPANSGRQRNSVVGVLHNLRHLREASAEERIAALRSFRLQNRQAESTDSDMDRERRVTSRLRDVFRIRTRREGGDPVIAEAESQESARERRAAE